MPQPSTSIPESEAPRAGFSAGILAALAMTAAMAILRYTTGTPSLPEIVGDSMISLMPASVFSAILDVMQKSAKPTLYTGIFIGMLLVGGLLGRGFAYGELAWRRVLVLVGVIWAAIGLVVLPLLGAGLFGGNGLRTGLVALAIQLALVIGTFACTLLLVLRGMEPSAARPVLARRRREALGAIVAGLVAIGAAGTAWKALLGSTSPVSTAGNTPGGAGSRLGSIVNGAGSGAAGSEAAAAPGAGAAPGSAASGAASGAAPEAGAAAPGGGNGAAGSAGAMAGPARGVPSVNAPSVPFTVKADQLAAAPFDLPKLSYEVLTPKEFYTVSKNLIDPSVDVANWSLTVDGLVERPTTYVIGDIMTLPSYSDYYTLQCISNTVGGDLWGNAHWKGVRLVELLGRAGLKPGIRKVVFHADDGYTDSITLDVALRPDALLAYEMNGEILPKEHGYPARLLIPGIYGMKNVKWITRIELVDYDFKGYWAKQGWEDNAIYNTSTRIDVPSNRAQANAGPVSLGGVTFAGFRGIQQVEVSLDDGKTWEPAQIKPSLSQNAWNLWVFKKDLGPGTYQVKCRSIDGNGDIQTSSEAEPYPAGATGWHSIVLRLA